MRKYSFSWLGSNLIGRFTLMWERAWAKTPMEGKVSSSRWIPSNLDVPVVPVEKVPLERKVFFLPTGPQAKDVLTYEGKGEGLPIFADGMKYVMCPDPISTVLIDVPIHVKEVFLKTYAFVNTPIHLKKSEAEYYEKRNDPYSVWSFPVHSVQINHVLRLISPNSIVIAPGDGIGLIARNWAGKSVCTDRVISGLTAGSVVRSSITDTLMSSSQMPDGVLVLSYLSAFMTRDDWSIALSTKRPVFVLDVKAPPMGLVHGGEGERFFTRIGRGLWVANSTVLPVTDFWKETEKASSIMYSENLLRNLRYLYFKPGVYAEYVDVMRPFSGSRPLVETDLETEEMILAESVWDAMLAENSYRRAPVYCGVLGRVIESAELCSGAYEGLRAEILEFSARRVYKVHRNSRLAKVVSTLVNHYYQNDYLFFYSVLEDEEFKFSVDDFDDIILKISGVIRFKKNYFAPVAVDLENEVLRVTVEGSTYIGDTSSMSVPMLSNLVFAAPPESLSVRLRSAQDLFQYSQLSPLMKGRRHAFAQIMLQCSRKHAAMSHDIVASHLGLPSWWVSSSRDTMAWMSWGDYKQSLWIWETSFGRS